MTAITQYQFNGREVRTIVDELGEVLFVGKDVCDNLGYADHTKAMSQHCKGVVKRHPLLTSGGMQELRVLTEADVLRLVINSNMPAAEAFERWVFEEVLPSIRKTGSYSVQQAQPAPQVPAFKEAQELALLNLAADFLRVAPSGRLQMIGSLFQLRAPDLAPLLPGYAVDAPQGAIAAGSSAMTFSATDLLKRHGIKMATHKFNEALHDAGLLEQAHRKSANGGYKKFWSVTVKGEWYGKNVTSAQNPRETQPHWYEHRFPALLEAVGILPQPNTGPITSGRPGWAPRGKWAQ